MMLNAALYSANVCPKRKRSLMVMIENGGQEGVLSQMTDVPDNRRPRWPNFKQTEEVYNITIFFLILRNS